MSVRTSSSQFETLIEFMERHGDRSSQSGGAQSRVDHQRLWNELANVLNSDGSGSMRETKKWMKVWADWKNKTKKKASAIFNSQRRTGGGAGTTAKLSELEKRLLGFLGPELITGNSAMECGLPVVEPMLAPERSSESQASLLGATDGSEESFTLHMVMSSDEEFDGTPMRTVRPTAELYGVGAEIEQPGAGFSGAQSGRGTPMRTIRPMAGPSGVGAAIGQPGAGFSGAQSGRGRSRRRMGAFDIQKEYLALRRASERNFERREQINADNEQRRLDLENKREANETRRIELEAQRIQLWRDAQAVVLPFLEAATELFKKNYK